MLSMGTVKYMEQMSGSRIADQRRETAKEGGARSGFKQSSLHCPPVSAIQPNEVIIEPDTNTHRVTFTVVSTTWNLQPISVQERTPLSK